MRIIIELDAGAAIPEVQITSQGKSQPQGSTQGTTMDSSMKVIDAGAPKYMNTEQSTQSMNVTPMNEVTDISSEGASAGPAPNIEIV